MAQIKIITDSSVDLPPQVRAAYPELHTVPMVIYFGDEEYMDGENLSITEFYTRFRTGSVLPRTAMPMLARIREAMTSCAQDGSQVLCLTLSSGLSGTCDAFRMAAEDLNREHGYDITVVDTLSASLGAGLIALRAADLVRLGTPLPAVLSDIGCMIKRVNHGVIVDTLEYLWKGGRVTRTEAFVGNVLDIKPVLHVLDSGRLSAFHKMRGRKRALQYLVEWVCEVGTGFGQQTIGIVHWDCPEDAEEVADVLRRNVKPGNILISQMSATIGVHTGPGCLGIVFQSSDGRR